MTTPRKTSKPLPAELGPTHVISLLHLAHMLGITDRHIRNLYKQKKLDIPLVRLSERKVGVVYSDALAFIERSKQAA